MNSYWKEAATLMVIGRNIVKNTKLAHEASKTFSLSRLSETNYNVLFLKRSSQTSFMPEAYVFPGGSVDQSDLRKRWLELFEDHGFSQGDLESAFRSHGEKPYIYSSQSSEYLLPELSFRLCALRETFEETGLLLTTTKESVKNKSFPTINRSEEAAEWRSKTLMDSFEFLKMFEANGTLPDVFSLNDWGVWLTPTVYKKKRFDTVFYITFLNEEIPQLSHTGEAEKLSLLEPYQILKKYYEGKIVLEPPQIYEMSRLLRFQDFDELKEFTDKRSKEGMSRFLPVKIGMKNGIIMVLPGDSLYPDHPNYTGVNEEERAISATLEYSQKTCSKINRIEYDHLGKITVSCNIKPEYSHLVPLEFKKLS